MALSRILFSFNIDVFAKLQCTPFNNFFATSSCIDDKCFAICTFIYRLCNSSTCCRVTYIAISANTLINECYFYILIIPFHYTLINLCTNKDGKCSLVQNLGSAKVLIWTCFCIYIHVLGKHSCTGNKIYKIFVFPSSLHFKSVIEKEILKVSARSVYRFKSYRNSDNISNWRRRWLWSEYK